MDIGAMIKSLLPVAGSAIGNAALPVVGGMAGGALGNLAGSWFGGRGSNAGNYNMQNMQGAQFSKIPNVGTFGRMSTMTPTQSAGVESLLSSALGGMGNLPSADFGPIRQYYENRLNQEIVPQIAERFTGAGAGGQRSSAFANQLYGAGEQQRGQLAAMEQMFNQQNRQSEIGRLMGMLQLGFQPQFQNMFQPQQESLFSRLLGALASGGGAALTAYGLGNWPSGSSAAEANKQ